MKSASMRMEYQLPPQQTISIGPPAPTSSPHLQILQNVQQHQQQQLLNSMQPPAPLPPLNTLPLQVVHNLPHLVTSNNGVTTQSINLSNNANNNSNSSNSNNGSNNPSQGPNSHLNQNLPPPSQILHHLQHHNNNNNNNHTPNHNTSNNQQNGGNGGSASDENARWTQFQVQQLWRHHAYLNGMVFVFFFSFLLLIS